MYVLGIPKNLTPEKIKVHNLLVNFGNRKKAYIHTYINFLSPKFATKLWTLTLTIGTHFEKFLSEITMFL